MRKENILKKNWEFQDIINGKKQYVSKSLILYYRSGNFFKIGISIPKKFANAVERNRYKRQVREIVSKIDIEKIPFEVVLIIRKNFMNMSFDKKEKEIKSIIERLRNV